MILRHPLFLEVDSFAVDADVDNDADGDHAGNHGGAAAGKERQCDTGYRHQSHGHGDVFEYLEQEHAQKADDDQGAVQVDGIADDLGKTNQQERVD